MGQASQMGRRRRRGRGPAGRLRRPGWARAASTGTPQAAHAWWEGLGDDERRSAAWSGRLRPRPSVLEMFRTFGGNPR